MLNFKNEEQVLTFLELIGWYGKKGSTYQFSNEAWDSPLFIGDILYEKTTIEEVMELANDLYEEIKMNFSEEGELDWLHEWMEEHLHVYQFTVVI